MSRKATPSFDVTKHFVRFFLPGGLDLMMHFTEEEVASWNPREAWHRAKEISDLRVAQDEQPVFAFQFVTKARNHGDMDSEIIAFSPLFFIGGRINRSWMNGSVSRNLKEEDVVLPGFDAATDGGEGTDAESD